MTHLILINTNNHYDARLSRTELLPDVRQHLDTDYTCPQLIHFHYTAHDVYGLSQFPGSGCSAVLVLNLGAFVSQCVLSFLCFSPPRIDLEFVQSC